MRDLQPKFQIADNINHGGFLVIVARLVNICWFCFKWGLALAVIGGVAAIPFLSHQVDKQICCRIQEILAKRYPGLKTTVRSAEFVAGEGFRVRGISIADPAADGPRADLLTIEELFLASKTELKELLVHDPVITKITVRRPTLHVTRRLDGGWSASKLFPPPKFGDHPPEMVVENGAIEIFDPTKSPASLLPLRDVNLTVHPRTETTPGVGMREIRELQGMFACDYFRRVEFHGSIDPHSGACTFLGTTQGLDISPELRDALPEPFCKKINAWGELRAEGKFDFQVAYDPAQPTPLSFRILDGSIVRGQINDPRLPHPLTDVRANFSADNSGYVIDVESAKCSQAQIQNLHFESQGYDPESPKILRAEVRQLDLDADLFAALPQGLQDQWEIYQPLGKIDVDAQLDYNGQKWQPNITLRSENISFTHTKKFQYRFEHGAGAMRLDKNVLRLNMSAIGGNQPIYIRAEVTNPFSGPTFWFDVQGKSFPLDENLFRALPEKSQAVVRSLEPRGSINFYFQATRDVPGQPPHQHMVLDLNQCSIRYQKFPYPISNISGKLVMFDDQWNFFKLEGFNNSASITGEGSFRPTLEGNLLELQLTGKNLQLEQDLHSALPLNIQGIWRDLKPTGAVDLVTTDITYLAEKKQLSVGVEATLLNNAASIEPVFFPYRMDKVQGKLLYRDGHVTLQNLRAHHGNVEFGAEGTCNFPITKIRPMTLDKDGKLVEGTGDVPTVGPWDIHFTNLHIDNLDRELIQALPERLKKAVLALNLSRPGNLNKSLANVFANHLDFYHSGLSGEPLKSQWDLSINLFQNEMQCGVKLENVAGKISLQGQCNGFQSQSRGELSLESVNFKDYQFTNVSGPIWIDDNRVLLGEWVDDRDRNHQPDPPPPADPPRAPRPISANLFEGVVHGKGWIVLGAEPVYGLEATLKQANLAKIVPGRQNLQGKIDAGIGLKGHGSSRNGLTGSGGIQVSDAYVYELPGMIQLLKILRARPPDPNAFSKIGVGYRIEGEHIYLTDIRFDGDAINLHGSGDMDWQANVNVNLYTSFTKNDSHIPLIGPMISDTSRGMMLIRVRGPLQNPDIDKEALPALNQAVHPLQDRKK